MINKYFSKPLQYGAYKVLPSHPVPSHITRPAFVGNPNFDYNFGSQQPVIHTLQAIDKLRKAGQLAAKTLLHTAKQVRPGVTTEQLDLACHNFIIENGAYPTPIGFMGFPKSVCTSVNECLVHGIPDTRPLQEGDSLNIDSCLFLDGVHGDNSLTVGVGKIHADIQRLINITQQAVYKAIAVCRPGAPIGLIGKTIQQFAEKNKVHVCPYFSGHGIGQNLHMSPSIFPFHNGMTLPMKAGMAFTIQPVLTMFPIKEQQLELWKDGFSYISKGNPKAQFQHTVLITNDGFELLTLREGEDPRPRQL